MQFNKQLNYGNKNNYKMRHYLDDFYVENISLFLFSFRVHFTVKPQNTLLLLFACFLGI